MSSTWFAHQLNKEIGGKSSQHKNKADTGQVSMSKQSDYYDEDE